MTETLSSHGDSLDDEQVGYKQSLVAARCR